MDYMQLILTQSYLQFIQLFSMQEIPQQSVHIRKSSKSTSATWQTTIL